MRYAQLRSAFRDLTEQFQCLSGKEGLFEPPTRFPSAPGRKPSLPFATDRRGRGPARPSNLPRRQIGVSQRSVIGSSGCSEVNGNAVRIIVQSRSCPRNCARPVFFHGRHWRLPPGRRKNESRKPGDRPATVSTQSRRRDGRRQDWALIRERVSSRGRRALAAIRSAHPAAFPSFHEIAGPFVTIASAPRPAPNAMKLGEP